MLWALLSATAVFGSAGSAPNPDTVVLVGAGDIADCEKLGGAKATASLLDSIPGTVFTLGDHAYPDGSAGQFVDCYEPTWGRHKARTRPAVGNHEYRTSGAAPYFAYFGAAAGEPGRGYYSYDLGAWHVVVLNSKCEEAGCEAGSDQERWLRADLSAHRTQCTLAYWHRPRFSSGKHGSAADMAALWQALHEAGVELAISGHDHNYERFAPQDATGKLDLERGVRQFVAGTGGKTTRPLKEAEPNSEARASGAFGVLKLTLSPGRYAWEFVPVPGESFRDSGTGNCHASSEAVALKREGEE